MHGYLAITWMLVTNKFPKFAKVHLVLIEEHDRKINKYLWKY